MVTDPAKNALVDWKDGSRLGDVMEILLAIVRVTSIEKRRRSEYETKEMI